MKNIILVILLAVSTKLMASDCPYYGEFICANNYTFSIIKSPDNKITYKSGRHSFDLKENSHYQDQLNGGGGDYVTEFKCSAESFNIRIQIVTNSSTTIFKTISFSQPKDTQNNFVTEVMNDKYELVSRDSMFCQQKVN